MRRLILSLSCLIFIFSCGKIGDAINNVYKVMLDVPLFKPTELADKKQDALVFSATIDADDMSYTLPEDAATSNWGTLLSDSDWATIEVTNLNIEGVESIFVGVDIFSRDGNVFGATELNPEVQNVESCAFALSGDDDMGEKLTLCAQDWIAANGIPAEFDMEVSFSNNSLAKDITVDETRVTLTQRLVPTRVTAAQCKDNFKVNDALKANLDHIEYNDVVVSGYVAADSSNESALNFISTVLLYDAQAELVASMRVSNPDSPLEGGTYAWIAAANDGEANALSENNYSYSGTILDPTLYIRGNDSPEVQAFLELITDNVGRGGRALSCWAVQGDDSVNGTVGYNFTGEASVNYRANP